MHRHPYGAAGLLLDISAQVGIEHEAEQVLAAAPLGCVRAGHAVDGEPLGGECERDALIGKMKEASAATRREAALKHAAEKRATAAAESARADIEARENADAKRRDGVRVRAKERDAHLIV